MTRRDLVVCLAVLTICAATTSAATIQVGPTQTYTTVQAGYDAAGSGDIIEIDSGTYDQSAGWVYVNGKNNLTFRGMGATRPVLDAGGNSLRSKGIFVIESGTSGTVIENLELKNARSNPSVTGSKVAGVSAEGTGLTLHNCYIHDCDNGVVGSIYGEFLFEHCEFDHNGQGDGQTHNIYIGKCNSFTLRHCYVHNANAGDEVYTPALTNYILYNRICGESGSGSRELHLANAGPAYVIGNIIQQGNGSSNGEIITYGDKGINPNLYLYIVNNTIVNERQSGATFIRNARSNSTAVIQNNIFAKTGQGAEMILTGPGTQTTNWLTMTIDAGLVNPAGFDYHLTAASTGAIDAGTAPDTGFNSYALAPVAQYVHPTGTEVRPTNGTIDIGAYEYYVAAPNTAPTVNAGNDQTIMLPTSQVSLNGSASDDGQPSGTLTYTWSQVSGPATVSFANANAAGTIASGLTAAGAYVLQLAVNDGVLSSSDTLTVTVNPQPNTSPMVNAGQDVAAIYENLPVSLHAAGSDPDGDSLTYAWSQTAGQAVVSPSDAAAADHSFTTPVLANQSGGTMTFQVDVADGKGGTASDSVTVQVYMTGDGNHDWFVNVGDLQALVAIWGSSAGGPADFNGDNFVNVGDLQALVANWGRSL